MVFCFVRSLTGQRAADGHPDTLPRNTPDPSPACEHPAQPRHPRVVVPPVAQLHVPELHALHPAHLREPRLCVELLGGVVPGGSDRNLGKSAQVSIVSVVKEVGLLPKMTNYHHPLNAP